MNDEGMTRATVTLFIILLAGGISSAGVDGAIDMLPSPEEIPGWKTRREIRTYPPERMWEPIDGEAEQYLAYGCESLTIADYMRDADGFELSVEIYRMKNALMSFGIYAAQRLTDGPFLPVGVQGYQVKGGLFFFEGPYYIKLKVTGSGTDEADDSKGAKGLEAKDGKTVLRAFGEIIAAHCPEKASIPAVFGYFPKDGLVRNSFGYIPHGILGIKDLSGAFSARYRINEKEVTLYLLRRDSTDSAQRAISRLEQSLSKHVSSPMRDYRVDSAEGFVAQSRYHGPLFVLRHSGDVLIIAGADDVDGVAKLAAKLLDDLPGKS
jgi:hypothetical protein